MSGRVVETSVGKELWKGNEVPVGGGVKEERRERGGSGTSTEEEEEVGEVQSHRARVGNREETRSIQVRDPLKWVGHHIMS